MRLILFCLIALCVIPISYASDVQFHILTDNGNTFPILPPDRPRPANIIGETAHLAIKNPPAGMFLLTAANGTTHHAAPMQTGIETSSFSGGKVRVITDVRWDNGVDYTFRDQPFGTLSTSGSTVMRHPGAMPTYSGYGADYTQLATVDDSRFGLGSGSTNSIGLSSGTHGEYAISMDGRDRVGLDFGVVSDAIYYIYRGCTACKSDVVVGFGDPSSDTSSLPNDLTRVDHYRGWLSTGSCSISTTGAWSGTGSRTIQQTYAIPSPLHSRAGDHTIQNRYDDLSILPNSHSSCSYVLHSENNDDNRKHDMCVASTGTSSSTTFSYSCSASQLTEIYSKNPTTLISSSTTTISCGSRSATTGGGCSTPSVPSTTNGYRVSASCWGGPTPATPPDSPGSTNCVDLGTTIRCVQIGTGSWYFSSTRTTASVSASCSLYTNTPHLDLSSAMTVTPGLNIYHPASIPSGNHLLVILDDTTKGGGSGTERIQVFGGNTFNATGPFDFHLRPVKSGVLYDPHTHYGWVDTITYNTADLADMGYTPQVVMDGYGDGLTTGGSGPAGIDRRLCHGDCFMGQAGIDGGKPKLREISSPPEYNLPGTPYVSGAVYDHLNDRWHPVNAERMTTSSLYITIPFAVDTGIIHVRLYGDSFDASLQNPSITEDPNMALGLPCHLGRQTSSYRNYASSMSITAGDAIHIPILPEVRYVAFIGNDVCHWYDVSTLPSPLSSVSAGARTIPLYNGTILAGDLTSRSSGMVHVDVITDLDAIWQSEAYGLVRNVGTANLTWVVPPLQVNLTATARVNGATGNCGSTGVYCSAPVVLNATFSEAGRYVHGPAPEHGQPYVTAPGTVPPGTTFGVGMYGLPNGKCSGLSTISLDTGSIIVRDIPHVQVKPGDTITLGFEVVVNEPEVVHNTVYLTSPFGQACDITESKETAIMHVRTMTATLR